MTAAATATVPQNENEEIHKTISKNVFATIGARVGYIATRVMLPPFVLAHMGLHAYGLWATLFILISYVGLTTLGISNVYITYIAQYNAKAQYGKANRLISTGLMVTLPLCAIVFSGLAACWPLAAARMHIPPDLLATAKPAVLMVAAVFLISISLCAFTDTLIGLQKIAAVQKIAVLSYLSETILIYVLLGAGRGLRGMAEAYLARSIINTIASVWYAYRNIPWLRISPKLFSREALRTLVSFGGVVQLQSLFAILLSSVERLIALLTVGLDVAGILDLGKKWPQSVGGLPSALFSAIQPAASHMGAAGTDRAASVRSLYIGSLRYTNLSVAYLCGFMAVLAGPLVKVWLNKPLEGVAISMTLLAIAMHFHLLTGPGTSILKGIGRPLEEFYYCLPNLAALVPACFITRLIWGRWCAAGIAAAVCAATLLSAAFFLLRANRVFKIASPEIRDALLLPGLMPYGIAALGLGPAYYAVKYLDRIPAAAALAVLGAAYSLCFLGAMYAFALNPSEKQRVRSLLAEKVWPVLAWMPLALKKA